MYRNIISLQTMIMLFVDLRIIFHLGIAGVKQIVLKFNILSLLNFRKNKHD